VAGVYKVSPAERTEGAPTAGIVREQAVATDRMWAGFARTDAGMTSGWHHHGDNDSVIFVIGGALRMESGPGGGEVIDAGPGDVVFVPRRAIHRESNPAETESQLIVVRAGEGEPVFNVDRPE
jgi:uncharacterized RmlC-like cupin family protein